MIYNITALKLLEKKKTIKIILKSKQCDNYQQQPWTNQTLLIMFVGGSGGLESGGLENVYQRPLLL